ncbi:unnamed protein product [Sphagnum jensenii]|uniref:Uncharacterized protein n=1 Tax=Sphagnum jensenii TaxID=128206 RepID=A0ABP0VJ02_9BRYO
MRTTSGATIEGIDMIDDLRDLDDRESRLKVTHHTNYLSLFNAIAKKAFTDVLMPSHLIREDDINFGDFVNCDDVEIFLDGRTKYDYGTFPEKQDRNAFIAAMMKKHTVLRIPTTMIFTNALDLRLLDQTQNDGSLLSKMYRR